jgi:hypothetical protein
VTQEEVRRFKPSTVSRRMAVVAGFYRTCVEVAAGRLACTLVANVIGEPISAVIDARG